MVLFKLAGAYPVICGLLATVLLGQSAPEVKKAAESPNPNPMSGSPTAPETGTQVLTPQARKAMKGARSELVKNEPEMKLATEVSRRRL
jgi:hypothetical protein